MNFSVTNTNYIWYTRNNVNTWEGTGRCETCIKMWIAMGKVAFLNNKAKE